MGVVRACVCMNVEVCVFYQYTSKNGIASIYLHEHGGILDVVITSSGHALVAISVDDVGLLDHMFLS